MRKIFVALALVAAGNIHAAYTLKNGKLINTEELATLSVQEHFSLLMDAYDKKEWAELIHQALVVKKNFPETPFATESTFFLGVGHFHQGSNELANASLSTYLKKEAISKHFEEAIDYKFQIAERFKEGARKHILGWEVMPRWLPAGEDALAIYDEVISALPHHELGARALFSKAALLIDQGEYQQSIEAYQTLIRRFPKHELTPESYLGISEVYFIQCKKEFADPDLLDLAEINLKKFRQDFPSESRISESYNKLRAMQDIYAHTLYETGQFYERTKKPHASIIYYSKIVAKYPDTETAKLSEKRLNVLKKDKS